MSRPSIPKLSLAFKKTTDSAPLTAQPDKGAALLGVPALSSAGGNGSLSAPMVAVSMPKLNLPARGGHQVANGSAGAAQEPPPPLQKGAGQGGGGGHAQEQHAEGGQHAVYVLLPGLAFPSHPAGSGGPPLTVGGLKALCYETLCPPRAPSSTTPSPSPPQLEFFRLSALVRLTDDTIPAPPGLVVAGAHLQDQDLTLGLVERLVAENRGLRERMDLAGEALVAFETRAERDASTIRQLRDSIDALTAQQRDLQEKHATLLLTQASALSSTTSTSPSSTASGSSSSSSSSTLSLSSHCISLSAPASASVSPRGASPRLHVPSGACLPHPHTLSQTPRTFHNSFPSLTSPRSPSRPAAAAATAASAFSPRNGEGLVSPATSPRRRLACRTGNCSCAAFTPQPSASWICTCGHMSLKHAGGPP